MASALSGLRFTWLSPRHSTRRLPEASPPAPGPTIIFGKQQLAMNPLAGCSAHQASNWEFRLFFPSQSPITNPVGGTPAERNLRIHLGNACPPRQLSCQSATIAPSNYSRD